MSERTQRLDRCGLCRFFDAWPVGTGESGECRRRSPVAGANSAAWPRVVANCWCGEFVGNEEHLVQLTARLKGETP